MTLNEQTKMGVTVLAGGFLLMAKGKWSCYYTMGVTKNMSGIQPIV